MVKQRQSKWFDCFYRSFMIDKWSCYSKMTVFCIVSYWIGLDCNILCCIVLYCIVLYCVVLHCIVLCCIVLCCVVLYCIVLCCISLYCIVLYCIVLCCVVLCCIVLYCIVLCCVVLCCIVLYCIVFCCVVLYCIVLYCLKRSKSYLSKLAIQSATLQTFGWFLKTLLRGQHRADSSRYIPSLLLLILSFRYSPLM